MSRSLHTQKLDQRSERRLARPYGARRSEAVRLAGRAERAPAVRESAASADGPIAVASPTRKPLKVEAGCPAPGFLNPLTVREVREFLTRLGASACYGLRRVRLRRECVFGPRSILFAEYVLPGEIHLYSVPVSPWQLRFVLTPTEAAMFARHGARVTLDAERGCSTVEWKPAGLRDFFLFEVLAHELVHHQLQLRHIKSLISPRSRADYEHLAKLHTRRAGRNFEGAPRES